MTAHAALSLIALVAGLAYIGLMAAGLATSHGDVPIRNLTRAVRLYGWVIATEAVVLATRVVQRSVVWSLVSLATLVAAVYVQHLVRQRRSIKADRVVADAERTVRDWRGDLS